MPDETTVTLSVKIPPATKERLDGDAARNFRSTTSHLLYILDWYFAQAEEADEFDQTNGKRPRRVTKPIKA